MIAFLGWTLLAGLGAVVLAQPIRVLAGLVEWEGKRGKLTVGSPTGLALTGSIGVLALAFHAGIIGTMAGGGGNNLGLNDPEFTYDPPATPSVSYVAPIDSSTALVVIGAFFGDQDDTHDSTRIMLDSAGGDFTSPLIDSIMGPQEVDTLQGNAVLAHLGVYDVVALYKGVGGGWSDTSAVHQYSNIIVPAQITTLSVVAAADDSLKLQWVTVHNGKGVIAFHNRRYKNVTGDTASFNWGGTQEGASSVFDSLGTNIGDTVSAWVTGLLSDNEYEFRMAAYRDDNEDGAPPFVYGALSNIASGTTTGTQPDTTNTPSITGRTVIDSSTVSFTASGFAGGSQTHTSSQWEVSRYAGTFSTLIDSTSTAAKTSITIQSNTVFKADSVYAARVTYTGSADVSAVSDTVAFTMTQPGGGSEGHTNEPSGMVPLGENNFSAIPGDGWGGAFLPGRYSIVDDGTTDAGTAPTSPGDVLQWRYPPNTNSFGGQGTKITLAGPVDHRTIYVHVQGFQIDAGFVGHNSNVNKIFFMFTSQGGTIFVNARGVGANPLLLEIWNQDNDVNGKLRFNGGVGDYSTKTNGVTPTSSQATLTRAVWHDLEFIFVFNTIGQENGEFHAWLNGVKTHEYVGLTIISEIDKWDALYWHHIWGGAGQVSGDDPMFFWTDHLYVSGK